MSSKAVLKCDPLERVGNFTLADGKVTVIEYSDLPEKLAADFEMVGDQARTRRRQAGQAFYEGNADMARGTLALGHAIVRL